MQVKSIIAVLVFLIADFAYAKSPAWVRITDVAYAGSGCPAGSLYTKLKGDYSALLLYFDDFIAETGPGIPWSEKRKNCQINVSLDYPNGWQFAFTKGFASGFYDLDPGVKATLKTRFYFQGRHKSSLYKESVVGPQRDSFFALGIFDEDETVWSPCKVKRSLNINLSATVTKRGGRSRYASGVLMLDRAGGSSKSLTWRRCKSS